MTPEALARAAERVAASRHLLVSTGAGMSKESGIPTFRDAREGIWTRFDPQELATEQGFRSAPARVWAWYASRRARMAACRPHAGHQALVTFERMLPAFTLVTQNIDGLHQRAGSTKVIELHGSIERCRCLECGRPGTVPVPEAAEVQEQDPPRCGSCGAPLRPDVVWFGEMLPPPAVDAAWKAAATCDLLLVVGTSGLVWPAAELPHVARSNGALIVEVSPEPSEVTPLADIYLEGPAGTVLPALLDAVAGSI